MDYQTAYQRLYREIGLYMDTHERAFERLKKLQQELEDEYIEDSLTPIHLNFNKEPPVNSE